MIEYLDDADKVKQRKDKSVLAIKTMCPEELLNPDVSVPKDVKHLYLDLGFHEDYISLQKYLHKKHCDCETLDHCNKCSWEKKFRDTLCKDVLFFDSLESLHACNLKLSSELWIQFAQNSKCLKKITFEAGEYDEFFFEGEDDYYLGLLSSEKHEALDSIFKIPTLEEISFVLLELGYFPKGPSNIQRLQLDRVRNYELDDVNKFNDFDLSTHTNLKHVNIKMCYLKDSPFKFSTLQLHKLDKLEELDFRGGLILDEDDFESLRGVLQLPNFRRLNMRQIAKEDLNDEYFKLVGRDFGYKMLKQVPSWYASHVAV